MEGKLVFYPKCRNWTEPRNSCAAHTHTHARARTHTRQHAATHTRTTWALYGKHK